MSPWQRDAVERTWKLKPNRRGNEHTRGAGARPGESCKRPSNGFAAICCSVNGNNSGWGSQLRRQLGLHIDEVVPNSWLPRSCQATWGGREHLSNVMSEGEPIDEVPFALMCPSLPTLAARIQPPRFSVRDQIPDVTGQARWVNTSTGRWR